MARILIVDDNPALRALLKRLLAGALGHEAVEAENGLAAVEAFDRVRPDLVLMDLWMPGMDGLEAFKRIRANPQNVDTPIIFVSADTEKSRWVEAFAAGANDFVAKPYDKNELAARIATHLKLASLTRELKAKNALLDRENYLAGHVQKQLLPQRLDFTGLETATVYQAQDLIGGDFYDAWEHDGTVFLVMADISGHGASAALLMAVCKGLMLSLGRTGAGPEELMGELNQLLYALLDGGDLDMYVTMVLAAVKPGLDRIGIISAGHAPCWLIGAGEGGLTRLESNGPALGLHRDYPWREERHDFTAGQTLLLLTDGLIELRSPEGDFFGEERLTGLLRPDRRPKDLIGEIIEAALPFCMGRLHDDLAILAARRI